MLRETLHMLAGSGTLKRTASHNPVARRLAARFVAGETLDHALTAVQDVNEAGLTASLDHLGENVTTPAEAQAAADDAKEILRAIAAQNLRANISCKLTQFGLDLSHDLALGLMAAIVAEAASLGTFVRVDMEGSKYTQATLDIVRQIHDMHADVGTVIQSMLYRGEEDIRALTRDGIRIRLVKGAYLEPPSIAYPDKRDVDENYRRLSELLLRDGEYPAFGTHDEAIIGWIENKARELGRGADTFEFQMLYGIRRDLQHQLTRDGFNVRIYVPYGKHWYPYFMRRLAERPANIWFVLKNLAKG